DPGRDERAGEDLAQRVVAAEDFGAALCVVDGQSEAGGNQRRADAAEVVACGTAADLASEEADAGAHHDLDDGTSFEDFEKAGEFGEGGGEVGIPEADVVGVALDRRHKSAPHGFGLAAVALEVENGE